MFILRTITADKVEHNLSLGDKFSFTEERKSKERFKSLLESSEVVEKNQGKVCAFITTEQGNRHIPLFKENTHFIMSDSGKTFSKISYY